jgi:hypothetical protein
VWEITQSRVLCTLLLPPISLPGLVRIGSGHILEQSHCSLVHSSTWQTLTEGSAQPPEHRNVPPLHTLTRSPNCFQSLIFGFRKSESLRIRPLVFQLHTATPLPPVDTAVSHHLPPHHDDTSAASCVTTAPALPACHTTTNIATAIATS